MLERDDDELGDDQLDALELEELEELLELSDWLEAEEGDRKSTR